MYESWSEVSYSARVPYNDGQNSDCHKEDFSQGQRNQVGDFQNGQNCIITSTVTIATLLSTSQ